MYVLEIFVKNNYKAVLLYVYQLFHSTTFEYFLKTKGISEDVASRQYS